MLSEMKYLKLKEINENYKLINENCLMSWRKLLNNGIMYAKTCVQFPNKKIK